MKTKLDDAKDVFLGKVNQICSKFGLNNIMAQLYAVLYLNDKPLSLDDMVDKLKISKGSASINIRALERYGVVRKVWVKGSRKDFYEAEYDIYKVITDRIKSMAQSRLLEVADMIDSSNRILDSIEQLDTQTMAEVEAYKQKLAKLKTLHDQAQSLLGLFNSSLLAVFVNNKAEDKMESVAK